MICRYAIHLKPLSSLHQEVYPMAQALQQRGLHDWWFFLHRLDQFRFGGDAQVRRGCGCARRGLSLVWSLVAEVFAWIVGVDWAWSTDGAYSGTFCGSPFGKENSGRQWLGKKEEKERRRRRRRRGRGRGRRSRRSRRTFGRGNDKDALSPRIRRIFLSLHEAAFWKICLRKWIVGVALWAGAFYMLCFAFITSQWHVYVLNAAAWRDDSLFLRDLVGLSENPVQNANQVTFICWFRYGLLCAIAPAFPPFPQLKQLFGQLFGHNMAMGHNQVGTVPYYLRWTPFFWVRRHQNYGFDSFPDIFKAPLPDLWKSEWFSLVFTSKSPAQLLLGPQALAFPATSAIKSRLVAESEFSDERDGSVSDGLTLS